MGAWRAVFGVVLGLGLTLAGGVGALAETGSTGGDGSSATLPLWVAPVERPGAAPVAGEVHAGCGGLVAWTDAPAGAGTWAVRPLPGSGPGAHEVIGTWHRVAGLAPTADLGALAAGRYQLTLEGDVVTGRVVVVDCPAATGAPRAGGPATVAMPVPVAQPALPQDAEGNTIPPIGEETVRPAGWSSPLPASPVSGLLAVGLLAAIGVVVGARRLV